MSDKEIRDLERAVHEGNEAARARLHQADLRVDPERQRLRIESVEFGGTAHFAGLRFPFRDGLNLLVGATGTGKTALLEVTRYVLGKKIGFGRFGGLRLIKLFLGNGSARVTLVNGRGDRFAMERAYGRPPLPIEDARVGIPDPGAMPFHAYGWDTVAKVAKSSKRQLAILDASAEPAMRRTKTAILRVVSELLLQDNLRRLGENGGADRESLLDRLDVLREERATLRAEAAAALSRELVDRCRISVRPGADRRPFASLLVELLDATEDADASRRIARRVNPRALARLALDRDRRAIRKLGFSSESAHLLMRSSQGLRQRIETVAIEDRPLLEVLSHGDFYPARNCSDGEQAHGILALMLLAGEGPIAMSNLGLGPAGPDTPRGLLRLAASRRQVILDSFSPRFAEASDWALVLKQGDDGKRTVAAMTVEELRARHAT